MAGKKNVRGSRARKSPATKAPTRRRRPPTIDEVVEAALEEQSNSMDRALLRDQQGFDEVVGKLAPAPNKPRKRATSRKKRRQGRKK